jgi:hypothetical protein
MFLIGQKGSDGSRVREHYMMIKFSKFQDLICMVKTRITSKGD